ncbi:DNA-3-methyladenine glycosylase [Cellulomonas sp. PhB150]|uniref:DNA-3-methyladenine glycosylase family protein n=1 Tax=Cellulomonas sp. PhB150 TaxID=2485188 RepID=UPI000F9A7B1B|nr:DNA-3-methyladenine glycosylase 2 family protein [Cellulomonas sp. PhB150]ROS27942.1 3-methyladenine DNA glycosylase/8-oxoguanine DNA glycosylase [Cellulomonas sp. PhB150]
MWRTTPDGALWRATLTPDGPATARIAVRRDGVHVEAWGPGADHVLAGVPDLLGARDDDTGFDPALHPLVRDAHHRLPGLRLTRTGNLWEQLVPAVLEQRVVGIDAKASWRRLVGRHGLPAPGPAPEGMRVPPPPAVWAEIPVWEWRAAGVEGQRADTIRRAALVAHRLGEDVPLVETRRRLLTVRGIGPWTVAETTSRALGDADAVSVGDYHLAHLVGWALTGDRTDDAGMLELLEPWRPHRQRVIRLIEITQAAHAPRYGPRSPRARPLT